MMLPKTLLFILFIIPTINTTTLIAQDVTPSVTLCPQELAFASARKPFNHVAIERIVGMACANTPAIALCLSGGGYRAMISCLGFLIAAQRLGLLDATSYIAGLSGATWLLGPLLAYNQTTPASAEYLYHYREYLKTTVAHQFFNGLNIKAIEAVLLQKHSMGQTIQLVDIWGAILANNLLYNLDDYGQKVYLSHCLPQPTAFPFPLFSAVIGSKPPYQWLEASPCHVTSNYLQAQVPLPLFGNIFSANVAQTHWPEQQLGYLLGIFGSPYAFSIGDIIYAIAVDIKNPVLRTILIDIAKWHRLYPGRFEPATPPNYTYNLTPPISPEEHQEKLTLIDAGFAFNLPIPSLLHPQRAIDIIFICDASSDASLDFYPQLRLAATYAHSHGLKFPPVEQPFFKNETFLICKDASDPTIPMVIYFPNKVPDPTLKLEYSAHEFEALCSYMEQALLTSKESVISIIRERVNPTPSAPPMYVIHQPIMYNAPQFELMRAPLIIEREEEPTGCCCWSFHRP